MRNTGLSKLHYLLYALLIFALTGCGASNLSNLGGDNSAPGSVSSKLVWGASKSAAKAVASVPTGITSIQVTVTGTKDDGKASPVVRSQALTPARLPSAASTQAPSRCPSRR